MAIPSELVNSILARTSERKLFWQELSSTGFLTHVGETMIIVDQMRGGILYLRIADPSGKVIEEVTASQNETQLGGLLSDLYESARRQALRVDETLSDLKRNLDKL